MSEEKKNVQVVEAPTQPAINYKRRRAMVWYLLSMFLVAAILVAVSLFVQNRNLKLRDTEQTSNSRNLQGRIESLQEEERALRAALADHLYNDAVEALEAENKIKFEACMAQLEPYADALTVEAKANYETMKTIELPEESQETESSED